MKRDMLHASGPLGGEFVGERTGGGNVNMLERLERMGEACAVCGYVCQRW